MKHPFHQFPVHLYHAEHAPIVAHNAEEEQKALDAGYSEAYVHQEYPKHIDGVEVKSAVQAAALLARKNSQGAPSGLETAPPAADD